MNKSCNIIIADDHPLMSQGLAALIHENTPHKITATVTNGAALIEIIDTHQPELVILDLSMPVMDGIEATQKIRTKYEHVKIIGISMYYEERVQHKLIASGANGFIPKLSEAAIFLETIEKVLAGEDVFLKPQTNQEATAVPPDNNGLDKHKLSEREIEIIQLIKHGKTSKEISEALFLSYYTIETHRKNICKKLNISSPNSLIKYAIENF